MNNPQYLLFDTSARVREWRLLSGADFAAMDRRRTVVMVSCSPLEVHGPHLPVMTDYMEADGLSIRVMELLCERHPDLHFVQLPALYVATDVVPHPGSIAFRPSTVIRALEDLGRSLRAQGFEHIWVCNFHGGPRHFVAIEAACDRVNKRFGGKMVSVFSLLLNKLTGGSSDLSEVFAHIEEIDNALLRGDMHGGAIETSMMLHLAGDHIKPDWRSLPRQTVATWLADRGVTPEGEDKPGRPSLSALIGGLRHKIKYYEATTWAGAPAAASPEAGRAMIDTLAHHTTEALSDLWTGRLHPDDCHSPLWRARWLFTNETVGRAFELAVGFKSQVW